MYTDTNFTTKKALKEAVARGDKVSLHNPGAWLSGRGDVNENGTNFVEGPHYPAAHTWYAQVELADGFVIVVR